MTTLLFITLWLALGLIPSLIVFVGASLDGDEITVGDVFYCAFLTFIGPIGGLVVVLAFAVASLEVFSKRVLFRFPVRDRT